MLVATNGGRPGAPRWLRFSPWLGALGAALLYASVWWVSTRLGHRHGQAVLSVYRVEGSALVEVGRNGEVPVRAQVRFGLRPEDDASAVIAGLSGNGRPALLVPSLGAPPRVLGGRATLLPDEVALDGATGPETFIAVLCHAPLPPATVIKAAERALAAAGGEPDQVRTLDLGCTEARASIRKR